MPVKDKIQTPIRLSEIDYKRIKEKIVQDQLTFQKLAEVLLLAYLKGNKEIEKIVKKYADEKNAKKRRYVISEIESHELLQMIAKEHSPLRHLEQISKEVADENE